MGGGGGGGGFGLEARKGWRLGSCFGWLGGVYVWMGCDYP